MAETDLLGRARRNVTRAARHPLWAWRVVRHRFFPLRALLRDPEAYQHVASWTFGKAERRELTDIFPGIAEADVSITRAFDRDPNLSVNSAEALALAAIVRFVAPRAVLEIGTAHGNTTLNIAANAPEDARILTVDLPPDPNERATADLPDVMKNAVGGTVGRQFAQSPLAARIEQRFCDSMELDWSTLPGPFDLIFIDGCHFYPYVRKDTENALNHVRSGGYILWHDYGNIEDVSRAVDEVGDRLELCVIRGTRLALGLIGGSESA